MQELHLPTLGAETQHPVCGRGIAAQAPFTAGRCIGALASRAALVAIYGICFIWLLLAWPLGRVVRAVRGSAGARGVEHTLLILATFYTRNWCIAHLTPLARARNVRRVIAVVDGPIQPIEGVVYAYAPFWMVRLLGRAVAKFVWALGVAFRSRPSLVIGYHFVPGALSALLIARAVGARAAYQMTGGPIELVGGGVGSENRILKRLVTKAPALEWLSFRLAQRFDLVVVRGPAAAEYMASRRLGKHIEIVPGSVDVQRFSSDGEPRQYDLVSVCRLVAYKQPDHLLHIVERLRSRHPKLRTVVLGDGPLLTELRARAIAMGLGETVTFKGHVEGVETILRQSRIFVLTSKGEGLSIAMAEAMAAGAVPVVADVGELAELVRDGETGCLARPGVFDDYADHIHNLLEDSAAWQRCSQRARAAVVSHNSVESVAAKWAAAIHSVCDRTGPTMIPTPDRSLDAA